MKVSVVNRSGRIAPNIWVILILLAFAIYFFGARPGTLIREPFQHTVPYLIADLQDSKTLGVTWSAQRTDLFAASGVSPTDNTFKIKLETAPKRILYDPERDKFNAMVKDLRLGVPMKTSDISIDGFSCVIDRSSSNERPGTIELHDLLAVCTLRNVTTEGSEILYCDISFKADCLEEGVNVGGDFQMFKTLTLQVDMLKEGFQCTSAQTSLCSEGQSCVANVCVAASQSSSTTQPAPSSGQTPSSSSSGSGGSQTSGDSTSSAPQKGILAGIWQFFTDLYDTIVGWLQ